MNSLVATAGLLQYSKILLSGFGIDLYTSRPTPGTAGRADESAPFYECLVSGFCTGDEVINETHETRAKQYFENFAIPFAANVMSRLFAGNAVDFIGIAGQYAQSLGRRKLPRPQ